MGYLITQLALVMRECQGYGEADALATDDREC